MYDRFSVCNAYNMYATGYNGSPEANEYFNRLSRIGFSPGMGACEIENYIDDDREEVSRIYGDLVMKHNRLYVGYERYRRRNPKVWPWPGTSNMPRGAWEWLKSQGLLAVIDCYTRDV